LIYLVYIVVLLEVGRRDETVGCIDDIISSVLLRQSRDRLIWSRRLG